jgi:HlyD family secretion protein
MKMKTWLILAGIGVALLLIYAFWGGFTSGMPVVTALVKKGPIREFIDEEAKTRIPQTYLITMPFTGCIEATSLIEGSHVEEGQIVAQIVPRDLKLAVDQAKAAVERLDASIKENADVTVEETAYNQTQQFVKSTSAVVQAAAERMTAGKAKVDYATRYFERIEKLVASSAQSEEELERSRLQKVQSEVDYQQDILVHAAMVAIGAATDLMPTMVRQYIQRKNLTGDVLVKQKVEAVAHLEQVLQEQQRGTMRSPVNGVLLERLVSNERYLPAGTSLLEIGRLEDMEVEADVLTLDIVAAKVGDAVEIYGPAIGQPAARGKVARVFPAGFTKVSSLGGEQQRVKVIIHFDSSELTRLLAERRLGVGYRVRVKIFTAEKEQSLLIPRSSLFRSADNSWQVYVVRGGVARLQSVEVGLMNDEQAEILSGLSEDEAVVIAPESTLTDGARVEATKA